MASLNIFLSPTATISGTGATAKPRRVQTFATAAKGSGAGGSEEKGFFEWLVGAMDKETLVETDPVLQKVEGKSSGTGTTSKKAAGAPAPAKKDGGGGFGGLAGLFAKK